MPETPAWQYDEFAQIGTDYDSMAEVEAYDARMNSLRDIGAETAKIIEALGIGPDSVVAELGTGTGEFAIAAARACSQVYALDVSQAMLDYAARKAQSRGVYGIEFARAGFLTYEHQGPALDAIVSQLALHHLPDFWKSVALNRIWSILKEGGRFWLKDVVFSFDTRCHSEALNGWVAACGASASNAEDHIREEFSTLGWIMEGLLTSAGFVILDARYEGGVFATYLCERRS